MAMQMAKLHAKIWKDLFHGHLNNVPPRSMNPPNYSIHIPLAVSMLSASQATSRWEAFRIAWD
jgi:hypothetical protein